MFFGLMPLIKMTILMINAIAILSEDRFLARIGWSTAAPVEPQTFGMQQQNVANESIKAKTMNLISATRTLMRIPLIGINSLLIVYELLLG
ncbi:Yos1-like protein [Tuber borchii]|uniref:Yos1-like protein n=1 Tax=Tuber borchii TaxID=42251 RepID=A0A2T6ZKN6_TUBBO|nr:Yos1-like protein [Tuber borchii]